MHGKPESDVTSLTQLSERLDEQEQRIDCLQNTLKAITKEVTDLSIGGRCGNCERCLMLLKDGMIFCPQCGNGQPL